MSAIDHFPSPSSVGVLNPLSRGIAVTPSDTEELAHVSRALWVGGSGDIAVVTKEGDTITLAGVQAGALIPWMVRKVKATGTTATSIIAGW